MAYPKWMEHSVRRASKRHDAKREVKPGMPMRYLREIEQTPRIAQVYYAALVGGVIA